MKVKANKTATHPSATAAEKPQGKRAKRHQTVSPEGEKKAQGVAKRAKVAKSAANETAASHEEKAPPVAKKKVTKQEVKKAKKEAAKDDLLERTCACYMSVFGDFAAKAQEKYENMGWLAKAANKTWLIATITPHLIGGASISDFYTKYYSARAMQLQLEEGDRPDDMEMPKDEHQAAIHTKWKELKGSETKALQEKFTSTAKEFIGSNGQLVQTVAKNYGMDFEKALAESKAKHNIPEDTQEVPA